MCMCVSFVIRADFPTTLFLTRQIPPNGKGLTDTWKSWVCCTVRVKAPSDSPEQSSNAPLITQEVWRPAVTLSPSLISYQTHGSNKSAIFRAAELQGRWWLMRMWSLLYWQNWQIPAKWATPTVCDWLQWTVSVWLSVWLHWKAGIWESHISCSGSKGTLRKWGGDKDKWWWKAICNVWCSEHTWKLHLHTLKIDFCGDKTGRGNISDTFKGKLWFSFVAVAIGWIGYDNIALFKAIAEIL